MVPFKSILFLALCPTITLSGKSLYDDSDVVILTSENLTDVIGRENHILVEFYAPWCRYCQRLTPEYNAAATTLRGRVPLAKIDATENQKDAERFGVESFPTILWFVKGEVQARYPGTPSFEVELVEWVDEKVRPLIEVVDAAPAWHALGKPNVVLYAPQVSAEFQAIADKFTKKAYYFHVVSTDVEKVTVSLQPGRVSEHVVADGAPEAMRKFIVKSWKRNDVVAITEESFDRVIKENSHVLVAFMDPSCPHCKALVPEYEKAASALRGEPFVLAKVDASKSWPLTRRFEMKGYPTLLWFAHGKMAQKYDGRRSMGGIVEWVHEQVLPPVKRVEDPLPAPISKPRFALYAPELTEDYELFADRNRAKASFYYVKSSTEKVTMKHKGSQAAAEATGTGVDLDAFLRENQLPEFEAFTNDFFELIKAADVGVARVFYLEAEKKDFVERVDPLVRRAKRSLGEAAGKYGWTSVAMDDPRMKLNCHSFPCIAVTKDASPAGGTRYVFGDYKEEVWTVANIVRFFKDVDAGKAEGVGQGEQRKNGPRYVKHDEL